VNFNDLPTMAYNGMQVDKMSYFTRVRKKRASAPIKMSYFAFVTEAVFIFYDFVLFA